MSRREERLNHVSEPSWGLEHQSARSAPATGQEALSVEYRIHNPAKPGFCGTSRIEDPLLVGGSGSVNLALFTRPRGKQLCRLVLYQNPDTVDAYRSPDRDAE